MSGRKSHMSVTPKSSNILSNTANIQNTLEYDWRCVLRKATQKQADWPDKDDLLDVVYWMRQCISFIIGIAWALVPLKGLLAILLYVAVNSILIHVYVVSYQKVDEDDLGGAWEIAKEGFGAGAATFMVMWIVLYSALNF